MGFYQVDRSLKLERHQSSEKWKCIKLYSEFRSSDFSKNSLYGVEYQEISLEHKAYVRF